MLDKTMKRLQSYYGREPQFGTDGLQHEMDGVTKITQVQCDCLNSLHKTAKPDLSVETGLAYGFSTLSILDAMEEGGYGHHIAIDPIQETYWHGIALASIESLGFASRFQWFGARSEGVFLKLIEDGKRVQFFFFDGLHSFEGIMADFYLANQLLDLDGLLVFNYLWMPVGRTVASFISTNMTNYEPVPLNNDIMFAFRKVAEDRRTWNHFAPFDGSGREKKGFLRRAFGR